MPPTDKSPASPRTRFLLVFILFTLALGAALYVVQRTEASRRERLLVHPDLPAEPPPSTQAAAPKAPADAPAPDAPATPPPVRTIPPPSPVDNPDAERAIQLMREADAAIRANDVARVETLALQALELQPDNPNAHIQLGHAYLLQGRHADAIPTLETALRLAPLNPQALCDLSLAYFFAGNSPEALDIAETALRVHPAFAPAAIQRALILASMPERQDDAIDAYSTLTAAHPSNPGMHANYALVLSRKGRHDEALGQIDAAIALQPENATFYHSRAIFCTAAKRFDDAIPALKLALELAPIGQRHFLLEDKDLDDLRSHPGFAKLVGEFDPAASLDNFPEAPWKGPTP